MYNEEFPGNCGITVMCDFGFTDQTGGIISRSRNVVTKENIDQYISKSLEECRSYGIVLISLNKEQKEELEPILLKHKFKLVSEGLNSFHNGMIYLYSFENHEFYQNDNWSDEGEDWDIGDGEFE